MKKLFLCLLATMMFGFVGNAQNDARLQSTVNAQMVTMVNYTKSSYKKGMSLEDFVKQTGPYNPNQNDKLLLEKVYKYIAAGTPDCDILKGDNSILLTVAKAPISASQPAQAGRPCWKCIWEGIKVVIDIIITLIESAP